MNIENDKSECNFQPALSNSRLASQKRGIPYPKVSFDRMTLIGDLPLDRVDDMANFLGNDPYVDLWEKMNNRFKGKALNEKVYIEHDRLKADAWNRRNFRIEFNPNNLSDDEKLWIRENLSSVLENVGFTRLDMAFDFEEDLSDFFVMSDNALKKTVFYGLDGKAETKYFGVRDSDRFIRIYNKKQERKDNADVEIELENYWRFEIELKRKRVDEWNNNCFKDMHVLKPDWASIEKDATRGVAYLLLHEENEWGKISKNTKTKYRKLFKEISPIDLTDLMRECLKKEESRLQKELDFWLYEKETNFEKYFDFDASEDLDQIQNRVIAKSKKVRGLE